MKVLLLFPGISGIGFNSYGKGADESWISHGLCILSACAREAGYPVELIDLRCLRSWKQFAGLIAEKRPDVVGVTMMSVDFNPAMESLRIIKEVSPETVTVVGGPHPSIMTHEVESHPDIDHVITGEGEISFIELLRTIEKGEQAPRVIKGELTQDLDELPFSDRGLFQSLEEPGADFPKPFVTIIAGRGCKFNCSFCQPAERFIFGKKVRRRSPANVIAELEDLRARYAFKSMMIHDDCITEERDWVTEFCELYQSRGFDQRFACQSRADIICKNEDMIELMAASGLKVMYIGFESGSQRVLKFLRKGTTVEQNIEAARICRRHGVKVAANYMMGVPTETREEVMETVSMIRTIDPDYQHPAFYTPLPGSDLFQYCQDQDLSLVSSHDSYRRNATEAKIKGVDYDFLWRALIQARGLTPIGDKGVRIVLQRSILLFLLKRPRLRSYVKKAVTPFMQIRDGKVAD